MIPKSFFHILLLIAIANTFNSSFSAAQSFSPWNDLAGNAAVPGSQGYLSYYWDDGTTNSPIYVPGSAGSGNVLTNTGGDFNFDDFNLTTPGNNSSSAIFQSKFSYPLPEGDDEENPLYHIFLENATGINIGFPDIDYTNEFTQKGYGIFAANSSFNAFNNKFSDLGFLEYEEPGVPIKHGGAIFAKSDDATISTVVIDDNSTGFPNKFINCHTGIFASGIANLTIQKNNKDAQDGGFEACYNSIMIYNAPENSVTTVTANDATEYNYGLQMFDLGQNSQFYINGNWFNCDDTHNPLSFNASTASYKAISIQNILTVEVVGTVLGNIISNTQKGIHLRNIANRHSGQLQIGIAGTHGYSNQVHYLDASTPTGNDHYFGFWFENCDNLTVDNNLAFSNTTPLGAGIDKRFRGFSVDNTTNSNFCSNKAEQMGSGVWVYNKCAGTQFHGTTNTDCFHGFHLVNADLPRQGTGTEDWENNWPGAHTNDIIGTTANGILDWDYPNAGTSPCSDCDPTVNTGYVQKHGQNQHNQNCAPPNAPLVEQRDKEFGATVMDTIIYDGFPDENKYQDKEQFYKKGSDDSTFLALGVSNDIVYQNEFDSLAQTNVGKLKAVEDNLKNENFSAAASLNQTISPINQIEENKKQVVELQLSLNAHNDSMTSSEKVQWNLIADQDAIHGGEAVCIARARLNKDVVDDPIGYYRLAHQEATNTSVPVTTHGKMVPNPAREEVIYYYEIDKDKTGVLEIKDMTGRLLLEKKIEGQSNNISVSVSQVAPGIYFYRSFCDGAIVDESKLIIIK